MNNINQNQVLIKQQQLFEKKQELMFPINSAFYIPMYFYPSQPIIFSNPSILYPNMNIIPIAKTSSESNNAITPYRQTEREVEKDLQNSELYIPVRNQEKSIHLIKKKLIKKKILKCIDSTEQTERLRRKLANRPKTYRTQKKMYLKVDLTTMGIEDQGKRILRKRSEPKRKQRIFEQTSLKCEIQEKQENNSNGEQKKEEKAEKKIIKKMIRLQNNLNFYDPHAQIPKLIQSTAWKMKIEDKKMNLLSRQLQSKKDSSL